MVTALEKYADMKPSWDYPVIIESHINGIRSKEMNPNTPTSYDEIAEDAIHAHNTSFDLMGEDAYKDYMRTWDKAAENLGRFTGTGCCSQPQLTGSPASPTPTGKATSHTSLHGSAATG